MPKKKKIMIFFWHNGFTKLVCIKYVKNKFTKKYKNYHIYRSEIHEDSTNLTIHVDSVNLYFKNNITQLIITIVIYLPYFSFIYQK